MPQAKDQTKDQAVTKAPPRSPHLPADWEAHEADKARRKAAREKRKANLRRCLDPETAKTFEARKPLYEWRVKCTYTRPDPKGRMQTHTREHQVIGQTETDAWALFCDLIGVWPGPHNCDREIEQLGQINQTAA